MRLTIWAGIKSRRKTSGFILIFSIQIRFQFENDDLVICPYSDLFEACHIDHETITHIALQGAFIGFIDTLYRMTSTSAAMPCSAQKFSISWVSRMPPISEPAKRRRPIISGPDASGEGSGKPTNTIVPSRCSRPR